MNAGTKTFVAVALSVTLLSGCAMSVGPSRKAIENAPTDPGQYGIRVVDLDANTVARTNVAPVDGNFAQNIGDAVPVGTRVGVGDALEVTIWEAAPAALFGTANLGGINADAGSGINSTIQASRPNALPEMVVGPNGTISVPFAGQVPAAGRTLREIEQEIVRRLNGRAHMPQAIVRIARNETKTVAVLGDVKAPQRVSLTPRGERLLDAISQAGGTSEALDRMTIQITRGAVTQRMAARDVIRDPRQNIILQADDVITTFYQPYSFTVLGAAGKNEEVRFEGVGITLAQALGRVGGLQDNRADPQGVFLFRWEATQVAGVAPAGTPLSPDGRVPVVYKVDMKQPETFFAAQKFQMRDGDVVYVSNSRLADLQRFVGILSSSILPVATARTVLP